jgi:hypothetical protein
MDPPPKGLILDYAAPRKTTSLRMATRSVLKDRDIPEGMEIVETLEGKAGAVRAIAFAAICVALLTGDTWSEVTSGYAKLLGQILWLSIDAVFIAAMIWTSLAVIHFTWQTTTLAVKEGFLRLAFESPLKVRRHKWPIYQVNKIDVIELTPPDNSNPIYAVQINAGADVIQLYTGHNANELAKLTLRLAQRCPEATRLNTGEKSLPSTHQYDAAGPSDV